MPIKVLNKETISRIAAGEVIERPASVVKELVENSLDAGSSQVSVEVRDCGISSIVVSDNGSGIVAGEVELAFSRYATSKISDSNDLATISSLGFRGEALPSIVSAAQVDILTSTEGSSGINLTFQNGRLANRTGKARSRGTTVTVRNLFRQIPARLKFLKSRNTENSHIAEVISRYALAYPEVRFTLSIDGRTAIRTPGNGELNDAMTAVYGSDITAGLLKIVSDNSDEGSNMPFSSPRISGVIGLPAISRNNRSYLSFFVNRRWVTSRLLTRAVADAYHGLLMTGKYPVAVINIALPFSEVDVNVHPAKTEIKFSQDQIVFRAVYHAVERTLRQQVKVPELKAKIPAVEAATRQGAFNISDGDGKRSYLAASPGEARERRPLSVLRVLAQLSDSYIICEGPDGLYLIDQHAAHERIIFEQYQQQKLNHDIEIQGLLEPVTLEVEPRQAAFMESHYQDYHEFGFFLEPFGDQTYLVRAVPAIFHDRNWLEALRALLDSLSGVAKEAWLEKIAISVACHSAVLAGKSLNDEEMRALIRQLEETEQPHTCPHGRPTMIRISTSQLEREFGRS